MDPLVILFCAGIRIAVIAHGDYCDAESTYVTKIQVNNCNQIQLIFVISAFSAREEREKKEG